MSKRNDPAEGSAFDDSLYEREADEVYAQLLERIGEQAPQPRLGPTRRAVELLGDPQRAYPIIHITGTNGKTSTSRIIESILRAHGLRTGLLTSPHLERVTERIMVDGEPISNLAFVENWKDIQPYLLMVDAELAANGDEPMSFFEALTVLAFACFADAPVDVAVIEVGMGGEWDSTNVGDGTVAVFTPIALDHENRLGSTIESIARTKSGIIKPLARVVSAMQTPAAIAELRSAAEANEAILSIDEIAFAVASNSVAVGGQVISVRGLAGNYDELFLPLYGDYQAGNAALAIAAVESFIGGGLHPLNSDVLAEGLATATSPGRLQVIGIGPSVLVDAAHNPHGAEALAGAIESYFSFDRVVAVIGVLADKDAAGIVRALDSVVDEFIVTHSSSDRAVDPDELARIVVQIAGPDRVSVEPNLATAMDVARDQAAATDTGAVLVTGSISLVADVIGLARDSGWKP